MCLSLTKESHDTLRPCDNWLLPNRLQCRSRTVTRIKGQLIITAIKDMICWKPNNLILILLISVAKWTNHAGDTFFQAERTHFTKITHSLFPIKDTMNYKVLHCVTELKKIFFFQFYFYDSLLEFRRCLTIPILIINIRIIIRGV